MITLWNERPALMKKKIYLEKAGVDICMDCNDYQVVAPAYDFNPDMPEDFRDHWVCLYCGAAWWIL